jgi:hypothetical protein
MEGVIAAITGETLTEVEDILELLSSGSITLDGFEGIYTTGCCEEPRTAATGYIVAADLFSFSGSTAAVAQLLRFHLAAVRSTSD